MVPTLAAHVATTATITDGHAMIATHFASAAWLTRRLLTIFATCSRRHGASRILVWNCQDVKRGFRWSYSGVSLVRDHDDCCHNYPD